LPGPYWTLVVGTFITRAGSFIVPLLFVYLTQVRGLSLSAAGLVTSLFGAGALLGSLAGGSLADGLGRKRTILLSLVSGALTMLLLGAAREPWQLAITAFSLGLTGDMYRPAAQAVVADVVAPAHRLKAFGIQYWAINLGFTFAALVGGFMAERNFTILFWGDAATTLALAAIVWRRLPETRPPPSLSQPVAKKTSFFAPFVDRAFAPFLVLNFLVVLVFMQHLTGLPADMHQKGLSTEAFGVVIAANGVLIVLLQPWVTERVRGIPRPVLLAAAAALTGLGFGLTALATTVPLYLLTVGLWTLGEIIFSPVNASIVADLSPAASRGRYQGAFTLTWALGAMVSPATGPRLVESIGLTGLWLSCALLGLVTAAAHLVVTARLLPAESVDSKG
jgi:MFS family permease